MTARKKPLKIVLQTDRLRLRHMRPDDAEFMLGLLNDPAWHRFIGDRGVRTLEGARDDIVKGAMEMVARLGFGFYIVERTTDGCPLGVCGLAKRSGVSFLPPRPAQSETSNPVLRRQVCHARGASYAAV